MRRIVPRKFTKRLSWSMKQPRVCWRYQQPVFLDSVARSPYGTSQGRRPPHRTAAAMSCDCTGRPEMGGWGRTPEVAPIVAIRATAAYLWWTGDPYSTRIRRVRKCCCLFTVILYWDAVMVTALFSVNSLFKLYYLDNMMRTPSVTTYCQCHWLWV